MTAFASPIASPIAQYIQREERCSAKQATLVAGYVADYLAAKAANDGMMAAHIRRQCLDAFGLCSPTTWRGAVSTAESAAEATAWRAAGDHEAARRAWWGVDPADVKS